MEKILSLSPLGDAILSQKIQYKVRICESEEVTVKIFLSFHHNQVTETHSNMTGVPHIYICTWNTETRKGPALWHPLLSQRLDGRCESADTLAKTLQRIPMEWKEKEQKHWRGESVKEGAAGFLPGWFCVRRRWVGTGESQSGSHTLSFPSSRPAASHAVFTQKARGRKWGVCESVCSSGWGSV